MRVCVECAKRMRGFGSGWTKNLEGLTGNFRSLVLVRRSAVCRPSKGRSVGDRAVRGEMVSADFTVPTGR